MLKQFRNFTTDGIKLVSEEEFITDWLQVLDVHSWDLERLRETLRRINRKRKPAAPHADEAKRKALIKIIKEKLS